MYYYCKIKNHFNAKIQKRKIMIKIIMSKKRSKYISAFDYFDKILIILSQKSRGIPIISIASIFGAPGGIACASFSLASYFTTGIIRKLLKVNKKSKEKIYKYCYAS